MPWSLVLTLVLAKLMFSKGRIKNQSALGEVGINLFRLYFTSCVYSFDPTIIPEFFFSKKQKYLVQLAPAVRIVVILGPRFMGSCMR